MIKTRIRQVGSYYFPEFKGWFFWNRLPAGCTRSGDTYWCTPSCAEAKEAIDKYLATGKVADGSNIIEYPSYASIVSKPSEATWTKRNEMTIKELAEIDKETEIGFEDSTGYCEKEAEKLSLRNDGKYFDYCGYHFSPCDWGGHYRGRIRKGDRK